MESRTKRSPEHLEVTDSSGIESDQKASPQHSSRPKSTESMGKKDFYFKDSRLVWKAYNYLEKGEASDDVMLSFFKDKDFVLRKNFLFPTLLNHYKLCCL